MDFDAGQPIWLQLVREFTRLIATGDWPAGQRVPSVRELAAELGVNPNTVQRALAELERTRLAVAERTAGRFVTTDTTLITDAQLGLAQAAADAYITQAHGLRLTQDAAVTLIAQRWNLGTDNPTAPTKEDR
ncbi:MAG: GntR family transcriptional regulator [Propioniciclava sp.]|uniref:GntR family transcriptional regulator n=1 Tax=Propioniciclava sp. TaxID=2038686 RepID=UPI0039E6B93B